MKKITFFLMIIIPLSALTQQRINIVPMPAEMIERKGEFFLDRSTCIVLQGKGLEKSSSFLNDNIEKIAGFRLKIINHPVNDNCIHLSLDPSLNKFSCTYKLTTDSKDILISGNNDTAVFYGVQSLIQLLPLERKTIQGDGRFAVPSVSIIDYPRFGYRGMHLDVGRHFFPVSFIKKYLDYLAYHKYNNFHWHLTEDQGWRIEIKKYPKLTQIGSCRAQTLVGRYGTNKYDSTKYCGYYTQEQIKEVVKYAADRYINIIPEIEMPGHSTAALASYPFLGCTKGPYKVMETWGVLNDVYCAGNDSTFNFIQDVLDEVLQLFPSKYIHIGGDECPKERWKACPKCQQRIKENHLKDEHALQSYFIQRIEKYLNSKGRNIIGWDEILEGGLAANATVMSWRGEEGGIAAARQNHDVVMTPGTYCYLDHSQTKNEDSVTIGGYLPLDKVYSYEPVPKELNAEQAKYVLGAQGNVWTEYMANTSKVEYMIFPRMSALSEVLWSPKNQRNWIDFERRLPFLMQRYELWGANYSKAYYDLKATVLPTGDYNGVLWKLETNFKQSQILYTPSEVAPIMLYTGPVKISHNARVSASLQVKGRSITTISEIFHFNKATGKKIILINEPDKSYPGNGAFTLVDGIQNVKKLARSSEFLGFLGKDMEATIDLGKVMDISEVRIHSFTQIASWIYPPKEIKALISDDGIHFYLPEDEINTIEPDTKGISKINFSLSKKEVKTRFLKVIAKNYGIIPEGYPGAGTPAWLFIDEIEVY